MIKKQTNTNTHPKYSCFFLCSKQFFNESQPQIYSNRKFMDHKAPKASFCGVKKKFSTTTLKI